MDHYRKWLPVSSLMAKWTGNNSFLKLSLEIWAQSHVHGDYLQKATLLV